METKLDGIIKHLLVGQNFSDFIKNILHENTMNFDELLTQIINNVNVIEEAERFLILTELIVEICIKRKKFFNLENLLTIVLDKDESNSLKKRFIKKVLTGIGKNVSHRLHDYSLYLLFRKINKRTIVDH